MSILDPGESFILTVRTRFELLAQNVDGPRPKKP